MSPADPNLTARLRNARLLAIGGSAGAVEALRRILPPFHRPPPFAIVGVLHLPSNEKSLLPSIFSSLLRIPATEAEDKEPLEPGHLYFGPPGYHLLIERDGSFSLNVDTPVHFSRPSIDLFFESAADAYGEGVVALLLTGANSDGALGLRDVIAAGGLGIVQAPASAASPEMPTAAIAANPGAVMLSPSEIHSLLDSL